MWDHNETTMRPQWHYTSYPISSEIQCASSTQSNILSRNVDMFHRLVGWYFSYCGSRNFISKTKLHDWVDDAQYRRMTVPNIVNSSDRRCGTSIMDVVLKHRINFVFQCWAILSSGPEPPAWASSAAARATSSTTPPVARRRGRRSHCLRWRACRSSSTRGYSKSKAPSDRSSRYEFNKEQQFIKLKSSIAIHNIVEIGYKVTAY